MSFFPSFLPSHNISGFEGRVQKRNDFLFSFSYKLSKEKQVKLLKIEFQKNVTEHIFQVFGQLALRWFSCRFSFLMHSQILTAEKPVWFSGPYPRVFVLYKKAVMRLKTATLFYRVAMFMSAVILMSGADPGGDC
jgi:hypothetical protein